MHRLNLIAWISRDGSGEFAHMQRFSWTFAAHLIKETALVSFHIYTDSFELRLITSASYFVWLSQDGFVEFAHVYILIWTLPGNIYASYFMQISRNGSGEFEYIDRLI